MQRIISYSELPVSEGESVYLKMEETDPKLYLALMSKGFRIVNNVKAADDSIVA